MSGSELAEVGRGRVLLVDDSVVVRKIIVDLLVRDPDIELVATASNGRLALEKLGQVNPTLVILDIEMPEMDGLSTLRELRNRAPDVPVLMFSGLTERGGALTLDALSIGAADYVTKPSNVGSVLMRLEQARDELLAKTKALIKAAETSSSPPKIRAVEQRPAPSPRVAVAAPRRVDLVALGASTGGPSALAEVISGFPADFPAPIVIAQHMPPLFTKLFAERLESQSHFRVREGTTGAVLRRGEVWIAPGDFHMTVRRDGEELFLYVHQGVPENSCRPSVDVLFRSAAEACGPHVLAAVLTGMGADGTRGAATIRAAGGQIIVQDEATSVVWSMPGSVASAGLADEVVPLDQLAPALLRRVLRGRPTERAAGAAGESST